MDGRKETAENRAGARAPTPLDCLSAVPYDEMLEYDLINNRYRIISHTEGKYFLPTMEGDLETGVHFAADNMVHPDDRDKLTILLDARTMPARMRVSPTPGMLVEDVRYKRMDGQWNWTRKVLVNGETLGLPDGIVRGYIYDIQSVKAYEEQQGEYILGAVALDERTGLPVD